MANRVTVNICGEDYTLVAEENTAYMEQVAALVDKKMGEVIAGAKVGRSDAAVLAAVNLADELLNTWAWAALTPAAAPEILRTRTSPGPWTTVTSAE